MNDSEALVSRFGEFLLDEANARLSRGTHVIDLPPKALAVLCTLVRQPDRLITKDALLDAVWGHRHVSDSVLRSTISQLRIALGDDVKQPRFIQTAARRGYRFVTPITDGESRPVRIEERPRSDNRNEAVAADTNAPTLVGRGAAMAHLGSHWNEASQGHRRFIWVTGEAGIGKTSLVDSFSHGVPDAMSARGQCVEPFGTGEPYLPVLDALAHLCRRDGTLPDLLRRFAPTWLLQMPWLHSRDDSASLQGELSGSSQDRMLREMGELLDRYTQDKPLLLVIEDLHWSDASTVRLIDHLARRRSPGRLMLVGTFRPVDIVASDHPLKRVRHELRAHGLCHEIALDPLSEQDVGDYVSRRFPNAPVDVGLVTALHEHTDGLPLFMVNVLEDLIVRARKNASGDAVDHWTDVLRQGGVPESLSGVIEKQLDAVDPAFRPVLAAASVAGMSFSQATVADAMGVDMDAVATMLESLAQSGTWIEHQGLERLGTGALNATYTFRHALYRRVLYDRTGATQRADWHQRIGRSLEKSASAGAAVSPAELAMHFERGQDFFAAASSCMRAAENALQHFAPFEASHYADHGLELLGRCADDPHKATLELSLLMSRGVAVAQMHGVASLEALDNFERAGRIPDLAPQGPERTWLLNGMGWASFSRGEFARAEALAIDMMDPAVAGADPTLQLCGANLRGAALCYSGSLDQARRWLEHGVVLAEQLRGSLSEVPSIVDLETSPRVYLSQVLAQLGLTASARGQAHAAIARAETIGHPMSIALAYRCLCLLEIRVGDIDRVVANSRLLADIVDKHSIEQAEGSSRWYRGWALAHTGEIEQGYRLIIEGFERKAKSGMYAGCAMVHGYAAEALMLQGNFDGASRHVAQGFELASGIAESLEVPHLQQLEARILRAQGKHQAARTVLMDSLAAARAIHATRYVVSALIALCELPKPTAADSAALRAVIEDAPADFDQDLRRRAEALLAG